MTRIAIIDYGSGNLRSVANALQQVATAAESVQVTTDAQDVAAADRIILPGVGAFADCWQGLNALPAMVPALTRRVQEQGIPFLGICVGMQLLATGGYEHKVSPGLGWIGGAVRRLHAPGRKIPHMGWNDLQVQQPDHPFFAGLPPAPQVYFVHSYHLQPPEPAMTLATADYGRPIAAVVGRDNILGTQFHPEKSQQTGLKLLRNFLDWQA
ncbi:MAG: imidazole glycerol phosphate synthase subunit HisH [Alphaproteobacteria bacterium]